MEGLTGGKQASAHDRRRLLAAASASALVGWAARADANCDVQRRPSSAASSGRTLRVGRQEAVKTIADAARMARDGDTVEISGGEYHGDVAVWPQNQLTIRALGGKAVLVAGGRDAEGKGIFVTRGQNVRIENLEFRGARVADRNGAGIRIERGPITIANCRFEDNENGILVSNEPSIELDVIDSSFVDNGTGDGSTHNLYAGNIARITATGCYFARARSGHLLKSRARESVVSYCRLSGEDSTCSYELEFPNGGSVLAIGNLIQQGPRSENSTIVSYGAEGYGSMPNRLTLAFNTIVNDRPNGATFVFVRQGEVRAELLDNLMVGRGKLDVRGPFRQSGNHAVDRGEFADPGKFNYRLKLSSTLVGRSGAWGGYTGPRPQREYEHTADSCPLTGFSTLTPLSPGAFQRLAS